MKNTNNQVDAYIANSQEFAKPILTHLRKLVHEACPDVVETIKWGMPYFEYKGPLCNMAAFKQHMAFGFWKQGIMPSVKDAVKNKEYAMGSLGKITSMDDLPSDKVIVKLIKEAMELNKKGFKVPDAARKTHRDYEMPDEFMKAIRKNKKALATFEGFSPTNKMDYIEWIVQAKSDETKQKRIETAVEWMSQGKIRNWKYIRK